MVSETSSVRDSVGSFKEWEDYNAALQDVLNWLSQAERTLESQERISDDVDAVKKQFHGHEVKACFVFHVAKCAHLYELCYSGYQ